jgi:hypothetical protein
MIVLFKGAINNYNLIKLSTNNLKFDPSSKLKKIDNTIS